MKKILFIYSKEDIFITGSYTLESIRFHALPKKRLSQGELKDYIESCDLVAVPISLITSEEESIIDLKSSSYWIGLYKTVDYKYVILDSTRYDSSGYQANYVLLGNLSIFVDNFFIFY